MCVNTTSSLYLMSLYQGCSSRARCPLGGSGLLVTMLLPLSHAIIAVAVRLAPPARSRFGDMGVDPLFAAELSIDRAVVEGDISHMLSPRSPPSGRCTGLRTRAIMLLSLLILLILLEECTEELTELPSSSPSLLVSPVLHDADGDTGTEIDGMARINSSGWYETESRAVSPFESPCLTRMQKDVRALMVDSPKSPLSASLGNTFSASRTDARNCWRALMVFLLIRVGISDRVLVDRVRYVFLLRSCCAHIYAEYAA